ncbi:tripartite tricarboxylate transporter substrate binding protein [Pollutimonas sp. H1-120]|uniref:Bug family tripartite tricarboxylate transporter substrate binding protein n=1 Tax=Pollutimonas sp. H1-120 TaxID=3148824 RepID=UPI003B524C94
MKRFFCLLSTALMISTATAKYPDKPIRIVVPFAAGSVTDVVTRELARAMHQELNQDIVVENRAGANGIVGTQAVIRSAADGYTLLVVGVSIAASNLSLIKNLSYDPRKDLTPIGFIAETPYILVADKGFPASNLKELYALAKKEPKSVSYAYASGSTQVAGAKLAKDGSVTFLDVPYQSSPQILTDIMGHTVDVALTDFARGLPLVRSGKLKAFGVTTKDRFVLAPDIPTLSESGAPGYEITGWFGLMGPAGMPANVTAEISAALKKALKDNELVKKFAAQGLTPKFSTSGEFKEIINKEIKSWGTMIKDAGIEPV